MPITIATHLDATAITSLVNSAYRGEISKQGWTTEANIIGGAYRILQPELEALMEKPGVKFLKFENEKKEIEGVVFLELKAAQLYLGMLSVKPGLQGKGIGHLLMQEAEIFAKQQHCTSIYMRVIHLRTELIEWYKRRGYIDTGKIEYHNAAPYETIIKPFHFIILQKEINAIPS